MAQRKKNKKTKFDVVHTHECCRSHDPNQKTQAALESAEKEKGIIHFNSLKKFFKSWDK